jgi:DNA uptake protein ComE-like DNA-binding protein
MYRFRVSALFAAAALVSLAACGGADEAAEGTEAAPATETAPAPAPAPAPAAPAAPATDANTTFLDPNQATPEQLLTVPGFDAALAQALVQGRPYADMTAVDRVLAPRLNEEQRDAVYSRLWTPIDLNTASKEEILLIPGVGNRMQHEFEEYRPYRNIEQFRREIGKYVDETEVARLERYVTIRS